MKRLTSALLATALTCGCGTLQSLPQPPRPDAAPPTGYGAAPTPEQPAAEQSPAPDPEAEERPEDFFDFEDFDFKPPKRKRR